MSWALVALGGALGATARHAVVLAMPASAWPLGVFAANALGCFLIGLAVERVPGPLWPLVGTGMLGGFTTFSAFSLDVLRLPPGQAAAYVAATLVLCLAGTAAGLALGRL